MPAAVPTLEHFLGTRASEFQDRHWLKQEPLHVAAEENQTTALLDRDVFRSLDAMCNAHADGPIQAIANARTSHLPTSNLINAQIVKQKLASGCTVGFHDFQHSDVALLTCLHGLTETLGFPQELGSLSLYITPQRCGMGRHLDAHDTWVVCLNGEKSYTLMADSAMQNPPEHQAAASQLQGFNKLAFNENSSQPAAPQTFELQPGDVLYIPRGYWHESQATGKSGLSCSLSFTLQRPSWLEALQHLLMLRLIKTPQWRAPIPSLYRKHDCEPEQEEIENLLLALDKLLPGNDPVLSIDGLKAMCLHEICMPQSNLTSREHVYRKRVAFTHQRSDKSYALASETNGCEPTEFGREQLALIEAVEEQEGCFAIADIALQAGTNILETRDFIEKLQQGNWVQRLL